MLTVRDPQSFQEAVEGVDKEEWVAAMTSEMESLIDHDVFELVPLPKGKKGHQFSMESTEETENHR